MALSTFSSSSMIICRARLQLPILPGVGGARLGYCVTLPNKMGRLALTEQEDGLLHEVPLLTDLKSLRRRDKLIHVRLRAPVGWWTEWIRTFSRGQWVLSLRKGRRFGRSYSAYRPICLSWYLWPLWWSRLNSLWRYCGAGRRSVPLRTDQPQARAYVDLNSPRGGAQVCLQVLPPLCPSVRGRGEEESVAVKVHHNLCSQSQVDYTYRYLVFVVKEHVDRFLGRSRRLY